MIKNKVYGSIDIGGTKIRMGLVDQSGQVIFRKMFLTPSRRPWNKVMDKFCNNFGDMLNEAGYKYNDLFGVGIGCPGTFDKKRENISFAPNLNWRNVPIKSYLSEKIPIPIWPENDTNLSTMGIAAFGEGRGVSNFIGIFIGTGIGGGIYLNKKLFIGRTGGAGEIGHMIVKQNGSRCHCGNRGCLESIASTSAIYSRINKVYSRKYKDTRTYSDFKNNANKSLAIKLAYNSGEPFAAKIIDHAFF
ncbi:ROK family protein, partial [candidate division KSB1 bacterium]